MSDLSLERTYIQNLASRLTGFEKKRRDVWNARCPLCGDSKKSSIKKRFYIFLHKTHYNAKCHNCGYSQSFKEFLKNFDNEEYKKMVLEGMSNKGVGLQKRFKKHLKEMVPEKVVLSGISYDCLVDFNTLELDHPARLYVDRRKLPLDRILYCPRFSEFIMSVGITHYIDSYENSHEPRIIIPFYRADGLSTVFQARAFSKKESLRYITIKEHDGELKTYGIERLDHTKQVYVLEGPFDSMMISNAIAMSGISSKMPKGIKNEIYVFDNEPRNRDVVKNMKKKLLQGKRVCIFPERLQVKDLNNMVVDLGMDEEKILDIINNNVYDGNIGLMKINDWAK